MTTKPKPLLGVSETRIIRAAQEALFPPEVGLTDLDVVPQLEFMFSDAKKVVRTMIRLVLWVVELSPLLARRSRFTRLDPVQRLSWLQAMDASSRPGIRGLPAILKVLVHTAAYTNPQVLKAMGLGATVPKEQA